MKNGARPLLVLLVLCVSLPSLVFGQGAPTGVVTALQGTATVARTAVPQPLPLKFKDGVYFQDRITTGDQSVARILLGGKALVTIRERSALTITEVPGRSSVNLEAGKIGLAVARERMAPGESVDIRTSNAIAAVRGTVVVAEVQSTTAQAGSATPQVVSNFYVLRDATNRGIQITQLASGATSNLLPGQGFSILGATAGRNVPIPANVTAGLQTSAGAQHSGGSAQATSGVAQTQTQQAVLLTNTLLSNPAPITTPASAGDVVTSSGTGGTSSPDSTNTGGTNTIGGSLILPPILDVINAPPPGPSADISGATITLAAGEHLRSFSGSTILTGARPALTIAGSNIAGSATLLEIGAGGSLGLEGPLLAVTGVSALTTTADLLAVLGTVTSITTDPLIGLDPTTVNTGGDLIHVGPGGQVVLSGPLLADVTGVHHVGGDVVSLSPGASLTTTTVSPLVSLNASATTIGRHVLSMDGATATLGGGLLRATGATLASGANTPLVELTGSSLTLGGPLLDVVNLVGPPLSLGTNPVVALRGNSAATVTAGPAIRINGGALVADALLVTTGTGNTIALTGTVLDLTGATMTLRVVREHASATDTVTVALAVNQPAIAMSSSSLTLTGPGATLVSLGGAGPVSTERGVALIASGGSITLHGSLLVLGAAQTTAGDPQITLTGTAVGQTGPQPLVFVDFRGLSGAMTGPMLDVTGGSITTAAVLVEVQNASLTVATPTAWISLHGTGVTTPGDLVRVGPGSHVTLSGSLLADAAGIHSVGGDVVGLAHGSSLTTATASPLISLDATSVTLGGRVLAMDAATATLGGGLLRASGATITAGGSTALVELVGSSLTLGGPVLDLTNLATPLALGARPVVALGGGSALAVTAGPTIRINGGILVADALVVATGTGNAIALTGTTLDLTSATVTLRVMAEHASATDTVTVSLGPNQPAIAMSSSRLTLTGAGEALVSIGTNAPPVTSELGVVLIADAGSTIQLAGPLLKLRAAQFTASDPQVQLTATTVTQTGPEAVIVVDLHDLDGTMAGPILRMTGGSITTAAPLLEFANGSQNGSLTASAAAPWISIAGTAAISGTTLMQFSGGRLILGGPLLQLTGTPVSGAPVIVLTGDVLSIGAGAQVTGAPGSGLIDMVATSGLGLAAGGALLNLAGAGLNLSGPLLTQNGGRVVVHTGVNLAPGANLAPAGAAALFQVTGGTLEVAGDLAHVPALAQLTLGGAVLSSSGSGVLQIGGAVLVVEAGGQVRRSGAGPFPGLVSLTNGVHVVSGGAGAAMFDLGGTATAFDPESGLVLGTTEPLQPGGALLEASGAIVTTQQILRLDPALLQVTAPIVKLTAGSVLSSLLDLVALGPQAKLTASLGAAEGLVSLDVGSHLTVSNGSVFNAGGASFLKVTGGSLLKLDHGSQADVTGGALLTVGGGSFFALTGGSLATFGSGANTLTLTNNANPLSICGTCRVTNAVPNFAQPVLLLNGASEANVLVDSSFVPFAGIGGANTLTVNGASGAVLAVDGASTLVALGIGPVGPLVIPPDFTTANPVLTASLSLSSGGTLSGVGTVAVIGQTTWTGGTMTGTGTTVARGGLDISGVAPKDLSGGRTLVSGGAGTWSGGQIRTGDGSAFVNTGTFQILTDDQISNALGGAPSTFSNSGTTVKLGTSGTTRISLPVVNTGTIDAQSGTVLLDGGAVTNTGGVIQAQNSGAVELVATVTGGTLTTVGSGVIRTQAGNAATLNGVVNSGSYEGPNASSTTLIGTITNNGTISLLSTGSTTELLMSGDVTLAGTGAVVLGDNPNNVVRGSTGAELLTNAAGHTIQGSGQLGASQMRLTNQGLILANQATPLTIAPGPPVAINTGTLRADGGTLILTGSVGGGGQFDNTGGLIEARNGSVVELRFGAGILGGTLATSSGGVIRIGALNVAELSGITNTGQFEILNGGAAFVTDTITNNGTMSALSTGATTAFRFVGTVTLAGSGTLVLGDNANNQIFGNPGDQLINAAGHTIQGSGTVGAGGLSISNFGLIVATQPTPLTVVPSVAGFINAGTLRADGGTLVLDGGAVDNTGGLIEARNESVVQLSNAVSVTGGTLATSTAGVIQTGSGTTPTLSGVTNTGSLEVLNNTSLALSGTITNTGTISLLSTGSTTDLVIVGDVTLAGTGTLALSDSPNNRVFGNTGTERLTNAAGHTIQGSGQVGAGAMALTNQGLIVANQPTSLVITPNAGGVTNEGTFQVNAGSTLVVTGGLTNLAANTLTGGKYYVFAGGSTAAMRIDGLNVVTNAATILLDGNGSQLVGNDAGFDALAAFTTNAAGGTFTIQNGRDFTPAGAFTNAGTIVAGAGSTFTLGTTTNSGTLRADGGTIVISGGGGVDNTGGLIEAHHEGVVQLLNTTVTAGTFGTSSGGVIQNGSTATLVGVTNTGSFEALNSTTTILNGTITNTGTMTLLAAGNATDLHLSGDVTLTGAGSLTLSDSGNNRILGNTGPERLTQAAGHTIQGSGQLGVNLMALTNQGLILANQTAALTIDPNGAGVINTGTLRADGGTLVLTGNGGGAFDNTGGLIEARNGSAVELASSASVTGGTLAASGGGVIRVTSGTVGLTGLTTSGPLQVLSGTAATLSGVTNAGSIEVQNGSTLTLVGTLTNTGTITLLAAVSFTELRLSGDVTLTGTGSVTLSDSVNNRILGNTGPERLTQAAGHTIQGSGQLGVNAMALTNQGLILANQATALTIDPNGAGVINTGTLRADGGTLVLTGNGGGAFDNTGGLIEARNGSAVELASSASVTGGTLAASGGGVIRVTSGTVGLNGLTTSGPLQVLSGTAATLSGVTNAGSIEVQNGSTLTLVGTLTNTGTITLLAAGNTTDLRLSGDVTLTGAGTVTLSDSVNNRILGNTGPERLTQAAGHTIQGSGQLGVDLMALTNQGLILANQATALTIDPNAGGITNSGTLQANAGSTLIVTDGLTNFSGTTLTGGTYNVFGSGSPGAIRIAGLDIVTNAATILLDGASSQLLNHITSTDGLANFATNAAAGSFTIQNGRDLTTAGNFTNAGTVVVGAASTFIVGGAGGYSQTAGLTSLVNGGLLRFTNLSLTGGSLTSTADLVNVVTSQTVSTTGSFVLANGGAVAVTGNLVRVFAGGAVFADPAAPVVQLVGGTHSMATAAGSAVFNLAGTSTALDAESGLTLGTDRPLRCLVSCPSAPLASTALDVSGGATVTTQQVVQLDTALLDATKPLIALTSASLTSSTDLIDLVQKAKLSAIVTSLDALVTLNASTLTINAGSLVNVGRVGGSSVSLTGNLFSLTNTSTLNINAGNLITVLNGSLFKLTTGSLGTFGSGTNTLNITNNAACAGCSIVALPNFAGAGVLLRNGAVAGNVTVNPAFVPFTGLNANNRVNISGTSGAVIVLDGANSRVNLSP